MNQDKVARAFFDLENTIGDFSSEYNVILYPVPASGQIYLRFDQLADRVTGEIFDINGRIVEHFEIHDLMPGNDRSFNISHLDPGVYSMRITIRNEVVIKRFVVK